MARKKGKKEIGKTRSKLIRGVPEDTWSEVRRYCREEGIYLRDFMARALASLRGAEGQDAAKLTKRGAREALHSIEQQFKVLERAEKLREGIEKRVGPADLFTEKQLQDRAQAEINRLQSEWVKQMDLLLPPAGEAAGDGPPPASGPQILERKAEESREEAEQAFSLPAGLDLEEF